jgi:ABC-2 type transport system ATP-binding protein
MLPEGAIQASNIWKRFRADRHRRLLRDQIENAYHRARGKSDPARWRWVLRDINLDVPPGQAVGLVGVNGSGKSTLLKILCRVMYPHAGRLDVEGRVGALIEVRAGIHPDLTGRENIYLYGSLCGLSRRLVASKFDEAVEFAELQDAVDRQVKFYSSGMQMRLGFAVAACMDPHILLVDEVLAVGDSSFQQKCLDRMRQVLAEGTTLVFVSHDLGAVEAVCNRCLWLHDSVAYADGPTREVLAEYRRAVEEMAAHADVEGRVRLLKGELSWPDTEVATSGEPLAVRLVLDSPEAFPAGSVCLGISEGTATPAFMVDHPVSLYEGQTEIRCLIPRLPLSGGTYYVWVGVFDGSGADLVPWHPLERFHVEGVELRLPPRGIVRTAPLWVDARWDFDRPVIRQGSRGHDA